MGDAASSAAVEKSRPQPVEAAAGAAIQWVTLQGPESTSVGGRILFAEVMETFENQCCFVQQIEVFFYFFIFLN